MTQPITEQRRHADTRAAAVIDYYETLSPTSLTQLGQLYTADAVFKDPFNDVQGVAAISRVFAHMFATLREPRFVVRSVVVEGNECFLTWDMKFLSAGGQPWTIHGASHLVFAANGRIARHRDYWDAAEELYAKLPLLGGLMRWLRRRLAA